VNVVTIVWLVIAATLAQTPAGWDDTYRRGLQLMADGKAVEAIRLFDDVVRRAPTFGSAHAALADAHRVRADELARGVSPPPPASRQALERAAAHYRRAIELQAPERPLAVGHLMQIYGGDRLDQPAEQAGFARQYAALQPDSAIGHATLAQALRRSGQPAAATAALLVARTRVRGSDRLLLATIMVEHAIATTDVPAGDLRQLFDYAGPVLDQAIAAEPADRRRVQTKVALLMLRADRVETDPERRQALRAEADRLAGAGRPAAVPPTPAPGRALEPPPGFGEASSEAAALLAKGQFEKAAAIYGRFVASHPAYPPPHYLRLRARLQAGRRDDLEAALKAARGAIPATADARQMMLVYLWDVATRTTGVAAADSRTLLLEAVQAADAALKLRPDYVETLVYKSLVLRSLAPLEADAARAKALLAEADRLRERAEAVRKKPVFDRVGGRNAGEPGTRAPTP
jgi:tetratricopeptide (TPR) repeat protein